MAAAAPVPSEDPLTELSARRLGPVHRWFVAHPRVMDTLVAAVYALPATSDALSEETAPAAARLAVVVLATAALLWRRRTPLRTAAAVGALALLSLALLGTLNGLDLATALVVYTVAAAAPPRTAWLTLGALLISESLAILLWERPVSPPGTTVAEVSIAAERGASVTGLLIGCLVAIAIGTGVRNRRLHVAALVDRANALAVERDQQARLAAAAERTRIAREMHDVVAHSVSVMVALADGAAAAMDRSPARARLALDELSGTGRAALADMRHVLGALRDPADAPDDDVPLDPQPGAGDLDRLVDRFRTVGLPVRWTVTGPPLPPEAGVQLAVYRIVQESLTNVLRHAPGTPAIDAALTVTSDHAEITVTDAGPPPGAAVRAASGDGTGRGLIGMRERAAVYGGQVDAGPHAGGWRVRAVLRWDEEQR